MMETYAVKPEAVEVHRVGKMTDVILRKDITEVEKTEESGQELTPATTYTAWECEEKQFRYAGTLTAAEVEADFDTWWEYDPETEAASEAEPTLEQQVTDLQVALCEVYELLAAE